MDDKNRRQFSAVYKVKTHIPDNRITPHNRTILSFSVGGPINRLRLLYMLITELSCRINNLSPPDSISQANIASEKSLEDNKPQQRINMQLTIGVYTSLRSRKNVTKERWGHN